MIGNGRTVAVCDTRDGDQDERDATLIASAPTWLAALCDALEAAEAEVERLKARLVARDNCVDHLLATWVDRAEATDDINRLERMFQAEERRANAAEARAEQAEKRAADLEAHVRHMTESAGDESCAGYLLRAEAAERERDELRIEITGLEVREAEGWKREMKELTAQLDAARAALRGLEQLFSYSDGMQCYVVPGNERTMPALRAARAALNPAQPTTAAVCGKRCASGSECLRLPHDDDRHETQHGCIFFDPAQPTTEEPTP